MSDYNRILDKLDQIDEKLDDFCTQQVTNTVDIKWIKRAGVIGITIISFLGSQLYAELTDRPKLPPVVISDNNHKKENEYAK